MFSKTYLIKIIPWLTVFQATIEILFKVPFIQIIFVGLATAFLLLKIKKNHLLVIVVLLLSFLIPSVSIFLNKELFLPVTYSIVYFLIFSFSYLIGNNKRYLEIFSNALLSTLPIMFFGLIVNLYIDPTIFGLISHPVYTDVQDLSNVNVTRRGISFISSPQSLSVYFIITTYLSIKFQNKFYTLISVIGGLLTGSKAYFLGLPLLLFFLTNFYAVLLIVGLVSMFFVYLNLEQVNRAISGISSFILEPTDYVTFNIWAQMLEKLLNNFPLLGYGAGTTSRYFLETTSVNIIYNSTESYIISLILELGLIGVALIFWIVGKVNFLFTPKNFLKIALILSMFFSPAFGGSVISVLGLPFTLSKD